MRRRSYASPPLILYSPLPVQFRHHRKRVFGSTFVHPASLRASAHTGVAISLNSIHSSPALCKKPLGHPSPTSGAVSFFDRRDTRPRVSVVASHDGHRRSGAPTPLVQNDTDGTGNPSPTVYPPNFMRQRLPLTRELAKILDFCLRERTANSFSNNLRIDLSLRLLLRKIHLPRQREALVLQIPKNGHKKAPFGFRQTG